MCSLGPILLLKNYSYRRVTSSQSHSPATQSVIVSWGPAAGHMCSNICALCGFVSAQDMQCCVCVCGGICVALHQMHNPRIVWVCASTAAIVRYVVKSTTSSFMHHGDMIRSPVGVLENACRSCMRNLRFVCMY